MKIKVCGMTERDNLRAVLKAEPDYVGFIFYDKSLRYVIDHEITSIPTSRTKKVGVFVNELTDTLLAISSIYHLDMVQLHGDESSIYCEELKKNNLKIIKAFSIDEDFDFHQLEGYSSFVDYFLFDTKGANRGGNGVKFDWNILNQYNLEIPFFLSGGITSEDVESINSLSHSQLYAIDINSGFEISPGIKDAKVVNEFVNRLKSKNIDQ